jgi:hypothetical protein
MYGIICAMVGLAVTSSARRMQKSSSREWENESLQTLMLALSGLTVPNRLSNAARKPQMGLFDSWFAPGGWLASEELDEDTKEFLRPKAGGPSAGAKYYAQMTKMYGRKGETFSNPSAKKTEEEKKAGLSFEDAKALALFGVGAPYLGKLKKVNWNAPVGGPFLQFEIDLPGENDKEAIKESYRVEAEQMAERKKRLAEGKGQDGDFAETLFYDIKKKFGW